MPEYRVKVREVHVQDVIVTADSPEEATAKVQEGEGLYVDNSLEYSHTLDPDTWTVEEE